jgi:hypothetical protein
VRPEGLLRQRQPGHEARDPDGDDQRRELRGVERLAKSPGMQVRPGNLGIVNRQFLALGKPGDCCGHDLDGAAWAALVVLPTKIGKSACPRSTSCRWRSDTGFSSPSI